MIDEGGDRLPLDPRYGKVAPTLVTCPGRGPGQGHQFYPPDIIGDHVRCRDCGKYLDVHNLQKDRR